MFLLSITFMHIIMLDTRFVFFLNRFARLFFLDAWTPNSCRLPCVGCKPQKSKSHVPSTYRFMTFVWIASLHYMVLASANFCFNVFSNAKKAGIKLSRISTSSSSISSSLYRCTERFRFFSIKSHTSGCPKKPT